MLGDNIYRKRMKHLSDFLGQERIDFALLTPSPAFHYVTGIRGGMMERLVALLMTPDQDPRIVAPSFEVSNISTHTWVDEFLPWAEDEDPYKIVVGEAGAENGGHVVAFDEQLPLGVYWKIEKALGGFQRTASLTPIINEMRLIKSDEEVDLMKKAGRIIDSAVTKAYKEASLGMTEIEIRQIVHAEVTRQGAEPTFAAVQFGENSAVAHATPGQRELKKGDTVLLDCGCVVGGYNTDMTRMGVAGPPSDEQRHIHSVVLEAQENAIEGIAPGLACGAADGIARKVIEEAGYGEYFTHRLGHGIGIQVHEPPYLVRGNALELQPGMTHSVEPGIYQEAKFGMRIEDVICVREDGAEVLTYTPKDLVILDL
ncbi:MAG: aminopeptidase P family protein [Candidatus Thorarchaeota archaeon]|nr:MAG: aminopeptidase P family protein [Candidatus Thorarchaeota archaeon]